VSIAAVGGPAAPTTSFEEATRISTGGGDRTNARQGSFTSVGTVIHGRVCGEGVSVSGESWLWTWEGVRTKESCSKKECRLGIVPMGEIIDRPAQRQGNDDGR